MGPHGSKPHTQISRPHIGMEAQLVTSVEDRFPADFRKEEILGKGSNNKVFRVRWNGQTRVLRAPRRKSDTQQQQSAKWEHVHAIKAAEIGVGPAVVDSWRLRHRNGDWSSGLYMVLDYYEMDLETLLTKHVALAADRRDAIGDGLRRCLEMLARHRMLLYDLKPSNFVVRIRDDGVDVRVIDFGRDFCEWCTGDESFDSDARTPTLRYIRHLCDGDAALEEHILFACMAVQMSATTSRMMYRDRHDTRQDNRQRASINPMLPWVQVFLDSMQGRSVGILRHVLRCEDVKGVLQHYQGRRYAGTRRTLRYASSQE